MTTLGGYWRDGDVLVLHARATLPDRCVVTGEAANVRVPRVFSWTPDRVALIALFAWTGLAIPLFLVLSLSRSLRATVSIPIANPVREARRKRLILAWMATAGSLLVGVLAFRRGITPHHALWLICSFFGFAAFVLAFVYARRVADILTLDGVSGDMVRLRGVHEDVLAQMPVWIPDSPESPRWEWPLGTGECIVASFDPKKRTERVWLGSVLISESLAGEKPDGHMVALGSGVAFRGAGVAEVHFGPGGAGCLLELDGRTVAPSPLGADLRQRMPPVRGPRERAVHLALRFGMPAAFALTGAAALTLTHVMTSSRPFGRAPGPPIEGPAPIRSVDGPIGPSDAGAASVDAGQMDAGGVTTGPAATGAHACIDGTYTCGEDGREIFQCKSGRLLVTYRTCRGPNGCKSGPDGTLDCDQSTAEPGDACWIAGLLACTPDASAQLSCIAGSFIRSRPCPNTPCSVRIEGRVACD